MPLSGDDLGLETKRPQLRHLQLDLARLRVEFALVVPRARVLPVHRASVALGPAERLGLLVHQAFHP